MNVTPIVIALLLLFPVLGHAQEHDAKHPTVILRSIPDLTQTIDGAGFAGGGSQFCAPVAVSNSLVWLEGRQREQRYQIELVKELASKEFMNTSTVDGTGTSELIRGVLKYAQQKWPNFNRLEYSGWRYCPEERRVAKKPTIDWMIDGLHEKSAVWINVGWYVTKQQGDEIEFQRVGGHWVTFVGHSNGKLILHDPAPRAGKKPSKEMVRFEILRQGLQTGKKKGLPISAEGSIALTNGMPTSKRADVAIVDGVVIFEIEEPAETRTWTSLNGKFSIDAQFVEKQGKVVVLQTREEKIKVPLKTLSKDDLEFIEQQLKLQQK